MFTIADLRDRPEFAPIVADRVWRAWWKPRGNQLSFIEGRVKQSLEGKTIPFCLVAHEGTAFLGTASVIISDLQARPQYSPWVAAVWVDPAHRSKGVGSTLIGSAVELARSRGFETVYLCAEPHNHGYYAGHGWRLAEENVDEAGLAVFRKP